MGMSDQLPILLGAEEFLSISGWNSNLPAQGFYVKSTMTLVGNIGEDQYYLHNDPTLNPQLPGLESFWVSLKIFELSCNSVENCKEQKILIHFRVFVIFYVGGFHMYWGGGGVGRGWGVPLG